MNPRGRHSIQILIALLILVALAVETVPLLIVSLGHIENPAQFRRTITTLGLSTALTVGLGVWVFTRVTRRLNEQLEAELAAAQQRESELLGIQRTVATVAHEINNPLAAQMMMLEALQDEFAQTAEAREMVRQALDQCKRMAGIVESLQQVSEPEYKTYIGKTQMLDLARSRGEADSAIT